MPCYYYSMARTILHPAPTFEKAYNRANGYSISTPYGVVTVSADGRRVTFQLYEDVRESIHSKALFSYYQTLRKKGVLQINLDHLDLPDLDKSLDLMRGKNRLDMVYIHRGRIHEVELETHRQIGIDQTRKQLQEFVKHCENLIVVVPRRDLENAYTIVDLIGLKGKLTIDTYEILEDEGEENGEPEH
jgi:hypothetical protein